MTADDILKNAVLAGAIMLSNGAETNRVEDTVQRILESYDGSRVEAFATNTGIFASIDTEEYGLKTAVKRIKIRSIHLGKVAMVNDLSRRFVNGEITIENLYNELEGIDQSKPYPAFLRVLAAGITSGCFAYMLGGTLAASVNAMIVAWISNSVVTSFIRNQVSSVITNLVGGAILSSLAILFMRLGFNTEPYLDETIVGAIMPMVPGIALTNAIRDILEGDFLSGAGRITDAVLVAVSIAAGVGSAFMVWMN